MQFPRRRLLWLLPLIVLAIVFLMPLPASVLRPPAPKVVQVEDRTGKLLYESRPQDAGSYVFLPLSQIPGSVKNAIIAIEDRGFYSHAGVSLRGITRAAWQNLTTGTVVSGGSSLTQQLIRNRLHPMRRTLLYKIEEAILALKLEQYSSKDQVLEAYLNSVSFGHQASGIAAAAKTYFGKSPQELSTAEAALLAGLVQSPTALDPFVNPKGALARRTRVLDAMKENNVLTAEAYTQAIAEPITLTRNRTAIRAPHFVLWLQSSRPDAFNRSGELKTTLDLNLQTEVEDIVRRKLADLKDKNVTSAAVVVLDAHDGSVLSMVGSADYFDATHDGAVNVALAPRQPGSTMKPFTYALALMDGDTPATTVADVETQFFTKEGNPYTPRNYDYGEHGLVRYREALANSYNIAAVKVLQRVGVAQLLSFVQHAGISTLTDTPDHYGLALTLGDAEVPLLELASAYGLFARGGETLVPRTLLSDPIVPGAHILDPKVAWLVTNMLSDNSARMQEFGEDSALAFDQPVAAKTGTTRNSRDNWTVGYSPDVIVGVWVGNADNTPMHGTSGVTGAGPIFHEVMLAALALHPSKGFPRPSGIVQKTICRLSGKLPTPQCPAVVDEWFVQGTEPMLPDDIFQSVGIDTRNGLLAGSGCEAKYITHQVFARFPQDVRTWSRENGWLQVPDKTSPLCGGSSGVREVTWLQILDPQPSDSFLLDPLIPDAEERVIFRAQASDDIRSVQWFVDGKNVGTGTAPSFRFAWKPTIGTHSIEAKGATKTDLRRIEVKK